MTLLPKVLLSILPINFRKAMTFKSGWVLVRVTLSLDYHGDFW